MRDREWLPDYKAFLASPEWATVRQRVMQRAGGVCEYCDDPATEVHHCTYVDLLNAGLCVAVCRSCHQELEEDRLEDAPAHVVDAPAVKAWATRRMGADFLRGRSRHDIGSAWLEEFAGRRRA